MLTSSHPTSSPLHRCRWENLAPHDGVAADTPAVWWCWCMAWRTRGPRYGAVAELNTWGFAVRGYDHYGHGESAGPRGGLSSDTRLLDDLADMIRCTRARLPPGLPLVLLGHSMGGLVAARLVSLNLCPVDALVLSSPALDAGLSPVQKLLVSTLPSIAPNLRVGNGSDANYLSHDAQVVADYQADPRCHDRISARLAASLPPQAPPPWPLRPPGLCPPC